MIELRRARHIFQKNLDKPVLVIKSRFNKCIDRNLRINTVRRYLHAEGTDSYFVLSKTYLLKRMLSAE